MKQRLSNSYDTTHERAKNALRESGFERVRTYIQCGNIILEGKRTDCAQYQHRSKINRVMPVVKEQPIISFPTAEKWRAWLEKNSAKSFGVRLRLFKKTSGKRSVTRDEALDEALCFGWIDGQADKYDDESWLQKFTPRRPRSIWSKRNREHIARLIKEGRMTPAGLKEVEAAKKDGRWDAAYDSPKNMEVPADFLALLKKDKRAFEFFETLNKTNRYAIAWRLATAKKPETRERRMNVLLKMLSQGKKLH